MKIFAIIPAGGKGTRCGGEIPKQYLKVNGKEIIAYTLEIFQNCKSINEIIVPAQSDYFDLLNEIKNKYNISKLTQIIEGGKERQDSVFNALNSLKAKKGDLVAVHDAARPLLNPGILSESLKSAEIFDSVLVAVSGRDTLVRSQNEFIESYLDRNGVYYAQTPQIFKYEILKDSMEKAYKENFIGTDESSLVTRAGYKVKIFEGSILNFKITTKNDVDLFEKLSKL